MAILYSSSELTCQNSHRLSIDSARVGLAVHTHKILDARMNKLCAIIELLPKNKTAESTSATKKQHLRSGRSSERF
eukprot:1422501-Amphidinium_carterae.1